MRINFDFGDLEAFLAVMESTTFHEAGHMLGLSQSAVTRRVQKLEAALDSELFERTTRVVKPTLAAKRLKERAEAMLNDAQETTLAMRDESVAFAHQRNAVVTIATIPTVVARLMPDAIRAFRSAGNRARIRVLDLSANAVAEAVGQGDADFGICSVPITDRSTEFQPLFDDPMVLVVPPNVQIDRNNAVTWEDLAGLPLILPSRGTGNRLLIDEAMARARQSHTWTIEVHRSHTALDLALGGAGIAIMPRSALAGWRGKEPGILPFPAPGIVRPVGLLSRTGQTDRAPVAAFKAALLDVVEAQRD